jgi:hypothetical protein
MRDSVFHGLRLARLAAGRVSPVATILRPFGAAAWRRPAPRGAAGCSHGWSVAQGDAEPVEIGFTVRDSWFCFSRPGGAEDSAAPSGREEDR